MIKLKKVLIVLFVLLTLCGCSNKNEVEVIGGDLNNIKERGYIIVAMEGTWAPWTYHDENDNLVGFDVEVSKYIADYLGVDVKYVEGEWDGLLAGVSSGRYDMLVNGVSVTDERRQSFDFSNDYAFNRIAVIVDGNRDDIKTMEDLKDKKTANTLQSVYAQIAESYGAKVTGVDDLNETFLLLKRGDIDATLNAEDSYGDYMKNNPDEKFKIACYYPEKDEIAIPVKQGSSDLLKAINEAIDAAYSDGSLKEMSNKYFGTDITSK